MAIKGSELLKGREDLFKNSLNVVFTGKGWCFTQSSTGIVGWLLLIFFIGLHNQLSSIHSISIISIDSKNGWLLLSQVLRQNLS